ncbi:hypothetical protein LDENG_00266970, partial [Lucifuga dentata]
SGHTLAQWLARLPHSKKVLGSILGWAGPFCVESACSPHVCVGFLQVFWFPQHHNNMYRLYSSVRALDQSTGLINWSWSPGTAQQLPTAPVSQDGFNTESKFHLYYVQMTIKYILILILISCTDIRLQCTEFRFTCSEFRLSFPKFKLPCHDFRLRCSQFRLVH